MAAHWKEKVEMETKKLSIENQPDEVNASRERFANWPNTFACIKFYRNKNGELSAVSQYDGATLLEMDISKAEAGALYVAFKQIENVVTDLTTQLALILPVGASLLDLLRGSKNDDSKDSNSNEGATDEQPTGDQSAAAAGVSGDS